MLKQVCLLFSFCFIILPVSDVFSGERLYTFDNDNEWEAITADWEIVDGEYVKIDPDTATAGIAVLKESEGVDTKNVESIEVTAWDWGTGEWKNMYTVVTQSL